jgi:hypothetical protein
MTLVIFGSDGRPARHVRLSPVALAFALISASGALAGAIWIGWKIGELTALL